MANSGEDNQLPALRLCSGACQLPKSVQTSVKESNKPRKKRYHCKYCSKCFSQNGGLVIHERIHLGHKPFTCDLCEKAFYDKSNLTKHKRIHEGDNIYKCKHCEKRCSDASNLKKHEKTHDQTSLFKCSDCGKELKTKISLTDHMRGHTGERPFACQFCDKRFTRIRYKKDHEMIHIGYKPFECQYDECDAAFLAKKKLTWHVYNVHSPEEKPFQCDQCNRRFVTASHLKSHQRVKHTEPFPFQCGHCPRRFASYSGKWRCERIHIGHTPFACRFCDAGFVSNNECRRHEMRNHTGERPAASPREGCPARFVNNCGLKSHLSSCKW